MAKEREEKVTKQTKNYIEYDPSTLKFKYPYVIHLQPKEGVPVVEIDASAGIPLEKYRLVKTETGVIAQAEQ